MNVMPVTIDGARARLGEQVIELGSAPRAASGALELGIRPEYVRLGTEGMPVTIRKVEDIGRHRVVRAALEGREIAAILAEDGEIPTDARVRFDPAGINIYADSWRVETGA